MPSPDTILDALVNGKIRFEKSFPKHRASVATVAPDVWDMINDHPEARPSPDAAVSVSGMALEVDDQLPPGGVHIWSDADYLKYKATQVRDT